MSAELLMETPRLRVIHIPQPGSALVVTFSNYVEDGGDRAAFGERFFAAHGIAAVHLIAAANHWFELAETADAVARIRALAGGRALFTYGSSMGGYAALRFAGALAAERAIALSPQYALDRATVPAERRWRAEARTVRLDAAAARPARTPAILFFDSRNPDAAHAALWAKRLPVECVPLPYAGHPATTFVAQTALLGEAVRAIVEGRWDRSAFLHEAHRRRRRSGRYLAQLASVQPARRRRCTLALAAAAVEAAPRASDHHALHAALLYRAGRAEAAEAAHRAARAIVPEDALAMFRLSRFLQRSGRYAEALAEAEAALAAAPHMAGLRRHRRALIAAARGWGIVPRLVNRLRHWHNLAGWRRGWPLLDRLARP